MTHPPITINGRALYVPGRYITYNDIIHYIGGDLSARYDVTYTGAGSTPSSGSLSPKQFINVSDATVITADLKSLSRP